MNILMFPGQGSQKIGMGKDFNDNFSVARDISPDFTILPSLITWT